MAVRGEGVSSSSERVAKATIAEWGKKVSEETKRNLIMIAMLEKRGRITYGHHGGQYRWIVRKAEHELRGFPDMVPLSYGRKDTKLNAYLTTRGYYGDEVISLREKLENGGKEAMLKVFDGREKLMREGLTRGLGTEIFVDGESAAGIAGEKFHGIETMMAYTQGSQTASDITATVLSGSYAGISTVYGSAAGGVASTHPMYRMWSPVIINTTYNPGAGVQAWADYAIDYIRAMLLRSQIGNGPDDRMDLVTLNRDSYEAVLNLMDDKERILVNRGAGEELVSLGFRNIVEIDGCPVTWDVAVPATDGQGRVLRGYGFTISEMELMLLGEEKQLFKTHLDWDRSYVADTILMWILGNLKFMSPRRFGKLCAIS